MTQVLDLLEMALQLPGFICCIREPSTAHQALKPLNTILETFDTWDKKLQLASASSIRPLVPELLQLLDDLGTQLDLIEHEDAIWTSILSAPSVLLQVLSLLLVITASTSSRTVSDSSSSAPQSFSGTKAKINLKHQQIVTQIFVAAGKLLGKVSAMLQRVAAFPDAAKRAACQKCLLAYGHAVHRLLASVEHTDVLEQCPLLTLDSAISVALSAARILWLEDGGDQHEIAALVVSDFDASVFTAYKSGVESQHDAAIELVLSAGEGGAMLQGPLGATEPLHRAAVDAWTRWLLHAAKHMQALLDRHSRTRLRDVQIHRLAAAACVELERLLSANHAGAASCTRWQGRIINICSDAAADLATMTVFHSFARQATLPDSLFEISKTYVAAQTDMLAMAHMGVLRTFPKVARWLLVSSRAASSVESPEMEDLTSRLISVPFTIGSYLVKMISSDRYSPLNRPPQQEVRSPAIPSQAPGRPPP